MVVLSSSFIDNVLLKFSDNTLLAFRSRGTLIPIKMKGYRCGWNKALERQKKWLMRFIPKSTPRPELERNHAVNERRAILLHFSVKYTARWLRPIASVAVDCGRASPVHSCSHPEFLSCCHWNVLLSRKRVFTCWQCFIIGSHSPTNLRYF